MPIDPKQLGSLPDEPGVYVFEDTKGRTLYVGKARSLRKRVRQYFAASTSDTRFLVGQIRKRATRVETIATAGDQEALILENSLIKKLKPRYNVKLRDDKTYLCIRVDTRASWPQLTLVRRPKPDGARYFGPYSSARKARDLRRFLCRQFMIRTCKDTNFARRTRPCLQHEMGRCLAPCTLDVDPDRYRANVKQAVLYLEGRVEDLIVTLSARMQELSDDMDYESAAEVRDRLKAVELARETQRVVTVTSRDQDAIGIARSEERVVVATLYFRRGVLGGVRDERFPVTELDDAEIVASYVGQYYASDLPIPHEVLLPTDIHERAQLAEALSSLRERKVDLHVPVRGHKRELVQLANDNAAKLLTRWSKIEDPSTERLARLQKTLGLEEIPERIECVDISHTAGSQTVGSLAVMVDGHPEPRFYRRYKIRKASAGDDYGAMRELLSRRFLRAREGQQGWEQPDLLVVDGGRGQLSIAREVLTELHIEGVALAAIAKDRHRENAARVREKVRARLEERDEDHDEIEERGFDSVWLPGRKSGIAVKGPASPLALLSRLRDEAHRFAVGYHRKRRSAETIKSELTAIRGVGPKTVRKLFDGFGSVAALKKATAEQIVEKARIPLTTAQRIAEQLK